MTNRSLIVESVPFFDQYNCKVTLTFDLYDLDISLSLTLTLQHPGCSSFSAARSSEKNVSGQNAMSVSIAPVHGN